MTASADQRLTGMGWDGHRAPNGRHLRVTPAHTRGQQERTVSTFNELSFLTWSTTCMACVCANRNSEPVTLECKRMRHVRACVGRWPLAQGVRPPSRSDNAPLSSGNRQFGQCPRPQQCRQRDRARCRLQQQSRPAVPRSESRKDTWRARRSMQPQLVSAQTLEAEPVQRI